MRGKVVCVCDWLSVGSSIYVKPDPPEGLKFGYTNVNRLVGLGLQQHCHCVIRLNGGIAWMGEML